MMLVFRMKLPHQNPTLSRHEKKQERGFLFGEHGQLEQFQSDFYSLEP